MQRRKLVCAKRLRYCITIRTYGLAILVQYRSFLLISITTSRTYWCKLEIQETVGHFGASEAGFMPSENWEIPCRRSSQRLVGRMGEIPTEAGTKHHYSSESMVDSRYCCESLSPSMLYMLYIIVVVLTTTEAVSISAGFGAPGPSVSQKADCSKRASTSRFQVLPPVCTFWFVH